jgi:hypothetical protein
LLVSWRLRGKGSVPLEEPKRDVSRVIYETKEEAIEFAGDAEAEEEVEAITVKETPKAKRPRKKPKRRRRRH